ncbi:MAG: DUF2905 family protein [Proteobacteria bacterium]|nr:DUF2905 family protein [Pseudomonadota bacterium]MBU1139842.1 DUF2905 family protein [Pseudomonadota bacterium]
MIESQTPKNLGWLPSDFVFKSVNFKFSFPWTSCSAYFRGAVELTF